jgi:CheY-like chemotaxis protein
MHGGRVEAKSEGLGKGSEFVVHLPVLPSEPEAPDISRDSKQSVARGGTLRVLVVDDNIDSAEMLALILSFGGHDVRTAHAGDTALVEAGAFLPQVVLLDIGLPKMNGYEVARRLRQHPDLNKSFLIALTGYGQDEDRLRSIDAGFNHHLTKPVDPDKLQSLITSVASR